MLMYFVASSTLSVGYVIRSLSMSLSLLERLMVVRDASGTEFQSTFPDYTVHKMKKCTGFCQLRSRRLKGVKYLKVIKFKKYCRFSEKISGEVTILF